MSKKIVLKSCDGESFEVDEEIALQSQTLAHLIEDNCIDNGVPLPNVTGKILALVMEYCKNHIFVGDANEVKKWDSEFMEVDQSTLFAVLQAADYLNIQGLQSLACKTVADMIIDKTPDQIRSTFNIENDYTPEEEEEIRKEIKSVLE